MTRDQVDQWNMLNLVLYHFDNNASIWSSNILISEVKATLSAKMNQIDAAAVLQSESSTGATKDKARLRTLLENKGLFVSSALTAYANRNPDPEHLNKKLEINKSSFSLFREAELLLAIENLHAAATEIIGALEPYGVFPITLDKLLGARTDYLNYMSRPEEITATRKAATGAIAVLLHEAIALLEGQMDHMMMVFRDTEPQFYSVYFKDRKIQRTGDRKLSLLITTLRAGTRTPLAKANIEIVGHRIKRISNQSGLNRVQNLKEGHYTLSVGLPEFVSQTIPFSIVNHQTTQLVIEMEEEVAKVQSSKVAEDL